MYTPYIDAYYTHPIYMHTYYYMHVKYLQNQCIALCSVQFATILEAPICITNALTIRHTYLHIPYI